MSFLFCECFRRFRKPRRGPVFFRTIKPDEYPILRRIYDEAFEGEGLDVSDFEKAWETRNEMRSVVITTPCNQIIGFALLDSNPLNEYVSYLAVDAAWRKFGYGSDLLKFLIKRSLEDRRTLYLSPLKHEPLQQWYQRHGLTWTTDDFLRFHPYNTRSHHKELADYSTKKEE